jgi:glycosyltransferase involved in cell wall biosynthesis
MELVERVNKGELVDADQFTIYEESSNSAEKFLAHHAHAMLDLRRAQQHMMQSLEAIDYSDQKVLNQFVSVSGFLGLTDLRTGPVVKFGASAIGRREYALGLEALANGISFDLQHGGTFTRDQENCLWLAAQYERAAQAIAWRSDESINWGNHQPRIAILVSSISDDDSSSRGLISFAKYHDSKRFKLHVYSTESGVRREKQFFAQGSFVNGSAKRGSGLIDGLTNRKVPTWIGATDGDLVSAAKDLANQLVLDKIDAILFDTTQADAIAALVASWEVARVKINLCRRTPIYSSGISAITYSDKARYESEKDFWSQRKVESKFIMEGIDLEESNSGSPNRTQYGIPENAVVLASAGSDLDRTVSDQFVESIVNVLRSHPHAIYLFIGEGELSAQKRKFESAGVGKRVGYAGRRKDMPGFLRIADIYISEFPSGSAASTLQAMSVERPVIALAGTESAGIIGSESEGIVQDASSFIERISKFIREPGQRTKLGKSLRQRVEEQFAYSQTARSIEQVCDQLLTKAAESSQSNSSGEPIAQAA